MKKYNFLEDEELTFAERMENALSKQDYEVAKIVEDHQSQGYSAEGVHEVNPELRDNISAILERNKKAKQRLINN